MAERQIRVKPFDFISFTKVDIVKNVNEHGTAVVRGLVSSEKSEQLLVSQKLGSNAEIFSVSEFGDEQVLFNGIITNSYMEHIGGTCFLNLELISHSMKLDTIKRTRTFQDISASYSDVTNIMKADSRCGNYLLPQHSGNATRKLLMQYEETDWEFAVRMASRLNTVVVSDFKLDDAFISIGVPSVHGAAVFNETQYIMGNDNAESYYSSSYSPIFYKVTSREAYDIGTTTIFNGNSVIISGAETHLVGSHLEHSYKLIPENGFVTHEYYNENLIGASIIGNIEEVKKDLVKVKVQNDVEQSDYMWFSYATVYSSPDNTGWYFMPEIGDEVRLHFPTQREWESYTISSVHLGGRADADTKSIRTKWGKEIVFTPTSIFINNGAGSNILLDDEQGIKIATTKTVEVTADENIKIDAMGKIDITGDKGVTIAQADNVIDVDEVIDISAEYVRVE